MRQRLLFPCFLAAGALWAMASVWINLAHGSFYVESDSASYLSLAHNLACGHGYARYDAGWSADWPPLIPFLLVLLSVLAPVPIQAFAALSAVCYGATLVAAGCWLQAKVSWQAAVAGVLLLLTSQPLHKVMDSALSEPLFLLLTVTFLAQCERYRMQASRRTLTSMTLLAGLCCLTRYTGLVTIAVGGFFVWQGQRQGPDKAEQSYRGEHEKLRQSKNRNSGAQLQPKRLMTFVLGSALPILSWCCLNRIQSGTFMGDRSPSVITLAQTLGLVRDIGVQWSGGKIPLILLCIAGVMGVLFLKRKEVISLDAIIPWLLFSAAYLIFLVHSACRYEFDPLDNRLLCPLYIPLVLSLVTLADRCLRQSMPPGAQRAPGTVIMLLLTLFGWRNGSLNLDFKDRSDNYSFKATKSSLCNYLKRNLTNDAYYSNEPGLYWLWLGRKVQWVPGIDDPANPGNLPETLASAPHGSRLVWFLTADETTERIEGTNEVTVDWEARAKIKQTLLNSAPLVLLAEFPNGMIFMIK